MSYAANRMLDEQPLIVKMDGVISDGTGLTPSSITSRSRRALLERSLDGPRPGSGTRNLTLTTHAQRSLDRLSVVALDAPVDHVGEDDAPLRLAEHGNASISRQTLAKPLLTVAPPRRQHLLGSDAVWRDDVPPPRVEPRSNQMNPYACRRLVPNDDIGRMMKAEPPDKSLDERTPRSVGEASSTEQCQ
jgi:hypothetical protein